MNYYGFATLCLTTLVFALIGLLYSRKTEINAHSFVSLKNTYGTTASVATIFASAMGAWILFTPAESLLTAGLAGLICYAVGNFFSRCILGYFALKIKHAAPLSSSLAEYALIRFGRTMFLMIISITIFFMFIALIAELTGIALAAELFFNIPLYLSPPIIGFGVIAYTATGGLKATIFTDKIQALFIIFLFVLLFSYSFSIVTDTTSFSTLLSSVPMFSREGIEYGAALFIAITGAHFFTQSCWQRVHAAKSDKTISCAFILTGFISGCFVILAGAFGFFAAATLNDTSPSVALFSFLTTSAPSWLVFLALILTAILVMSSVDSLLNGLVSIFVTHLSRYFQHDSALILRRSKYITVLLATLAIFFATKGLSLLYLFLLADLLCVAALFPTLWGLYSTHISEKRAVASTIVGIIIGLALFPSPSYSQTIVNSLFPETTPWLATPNLLWSFLLSFLSSAIFAIGGSLPIYAHNPSH